MRVWSLVLVLYPTDDRPSPCPCFAQEPIIECVFIDAPQVEKSRNKSDELRLGRKRVKGTPQASHVGERTQS